MTARPLPVGLVLGAATGAERLREAMGTTELLAGGEKGKGAHGMTVLERKAENQREVDISRRRLVEEEGKMRELEEKLEGVIARIEDVRRRLCKVMAEESSGRGGNMGGWVWAEIP